MSGCRRPLPVLLGLLLAVTRPAAAAAAPVIFESAPGQFEIAAADSADAQRVAALGSEAWSTLAGPLALPERFSSPVFVRLVPAAEWAEAAVFRVTVEAGGVVSARFRWDDKPEFAFVRRGLVQALLLRLAVAHHGVNERLGAPLWLEHACDGWWRTRSDAAQLDALKQETARMAPPGLGELLAWRRGETEPRPKIAGAMWLFSLLQVEAPRGAAWPTFLLRLLGGETPETALAECFPGRFSTADARELWWQTGWHHLRRANSLPTLDAGESRALLADAVRFVFAREDGADVVTPLRAVLEHAREPLVDLELKRRAAELNRVMAALHPFYRNAGLSLAAALSLRAEGGAKREAACAAFEQDWRDATELEASATAALDQLEREPALSSIK